MGDSKPVTPFSIFSKTEVRDRYHTYAQKGIDAAKSITESTWRSSAIDTTGD